MTEEIISMLCLGGISVLTLFFVIWVIHLILKNAAIVDVGWGIGFILLCGIYVIQGEGFNLRNTLIFILITLWGLRIAFYLFKRLRSDKQEDRRYQKIRKEWGKKIEIKFFLFFEFQALLQIILAAPFIVIALNDNPTLSLFEILGSIIFVIALVGETIADEQLYVFKSNPNNKGKTCDVGLWYHSRHPNYFFEWLVWMGVFVYALGSPMGWVGIIAPALMYFLMRYVSGVPMSEEQAILSRGDEYRKYQQSTSIFFPMPKRKLEGSS